MKLWTPTLTTVLIYVNLVKSGADPIKIKQCYYNISDPYLYFSEKTSYFVDETNDESPIKVEGKANTDSIKINRPGHNISMY